MRMLPEMDQRTFTSNRRLADFFELPDPLQVNAADMQWRDSTDSHEQAKKFSMATDGIWKNEAETVELKLRRNVATGGVKAAIHFG